ncbi:YdcF family protein [Mycolicibacterium sp. J2]|uniref:YdcF family protein n=1 Tax=Mycolicibacterium sp. J2 TaxID=2993511 RepID=UPI00224B6C2A|nr:YdcF family protein [Mycolicibacterium sp. J2]MCX2715562.1 YdcF family protein [Mycolicibacterium sp. J2]
MGPKWVWVPAVLAVFGAAEWATWKASRELTASADGAPVPGETVLVLGCPITALWKWRVRIAVRSTDPSTARFVFSGAAVRTPVPEAELMADYAIRRLGVPPANVIVEDRSRNTVQNIVNAIPLMTDSPAIKIVSNTFHARRARQILHEQAPMLAERLHPARDYIPGEWGPLHVALLAYHLYRCGFG